MKEYFVTLGGQDRRLRYTSRDGVRLFQLFQKPLKPLMEQDVMGLDMIGRPARTSRPDVRLAVLYLGLAHDIPKLQEEKVSDWLDQLLEEGGDLDDVNAVVVRAAYYSGMVLGKRVDLEEEEAEAKKQLEGKDPTATQTPPPPASAIKAGE